MPSTTALRRLIPTAALLTALAMTLAWVSSRFASVQSWGGFLALLALTAACGGLLLLGLKCENPPGWLLGLTVGAAALRLLAGMLWFILLPAYGYATDVQQAGYVMEDAFWRDSAAWELAGSGAPLWAAFRASEFGNFRSADQYGGMLFVSAAVYRLFGGESHAPLMMVVLTAGLSALAVPLAWAFTSRAFDRTAAGWAAWGMAIYPEAVLLGSSQMREAFIIPLAAAVFYGLALYRGGGSGSKRTGLAWLLGALLLMLPISPLFAGISLALLGILELSMGGWPWLRTRRLWAVLCGLALVVVLAFWAGWEQIAPRLNVAQFVSPLEMAGSWLELSARWQVQQTRAASGWLQSVFEDLPEALHLPFLIGYGVTRPLLPAQLVAYSVPVWWAIGVWRALGWTVLLALLLYAPVQALRVREGRRLASGLAAAVWIGVLIAAFWGGGDEWDNPRYRAAFVALQVALAGRVIVQQRRAPDPWMRRALIAVLAVPAWFVPWYLRRYTDFDLIFGWTVVDIFKLLGAGVLTGVLLAVWDWAKEGA